MLYSIILYVLKASKITKNHVNGRVFFLPNFFYIRRIKFFYKKNQKSRKCCKESGMEGVLTQLSWCTCKMWQWLTARMLRRKRRLSWHLFGNLISWNLYINCFLANVYLSIIIHMLRSQSILVHIWKKKLQLYERLTIKSSKHNN